MSKELEALERLKTAPTFMGGTAEYKDCTKSETLLLQDYEIVKQALLELQYIKESKPSEALKELEGIEYVADVLKVNHKIGSRDIANQEIKEMVDRLNYRIPTIKQALLKAQDKETGYKQSGEVISRVELCEAVDRIFGSEEKFLDIIEEDLPYDYHYYKYDGEEIYIIDRYHNKYINWYKLTHLGRDFHTDMKTKEEVIDFLQRLHDVWLKEKEL